MTAAELKRVPFRATADRMMTLGELCDLVGGRVPLVLELKSRFDRDDRLVARVAGVLASPTGQSPRCRSTRASSRACGGPPRESRAASCRSATSTIRSGAP